MGADGVPPAKRCESASRRTRPWPAPVSRVVAHPQPPGRLLWHRGPWVADAVSGGTKSGPQRREDDAVRAFHMSATPLLPRTLGTNPSSPRGDAVSQRGPGGRRPDDAGHGSRFATIARASRLSYRRGVGGRGPSLCADVTRHAGGSSDDGLVCGAVAPRPSHRAGHLILRSVLCCSEGPWGAAARAARPRTRRTGPPPDE